MPSVVIAMASSGMFVPSENFLSIFDMANCRDCLKCPCLDNGIDDGENCAADLLVKIAVRIPDDKEAV